MSTPRRGSSSSETPAPGSAPPSSDYSTRTSRICDAVSMEVLAGACDERHLIQLRGLLGRATMLPTTPADYEAAASMYRTCRASGETVRKLVDCLIAAVAVRAGVEVLHADTDFTALARHTELRIHPASRS